MRKAGSHLNTILEAETSKYKNLGTVMDISRVAASANEKDPSVFFVMVRDNVTCSECIRLHCMPDGITPRVWKLSELSASYGKRGDTAPSMINRHPHCRCQITYLSEGFGFNKHGKVTYHREGFDAYQVQQEQLQ
jgi:hypothetical protein